LLAIAACGRFGFDPAGGLTGDDDGGSGSNDVLAGCLSPGYGDDFVEITPCQQFGTPMFTNGSLNVSNGQLTITPNPNTQTSIGCVRASATFTRPGAFAEISQILPSPGETTLVVATSSDTAGFLAFNGLLAYDDTSGVTASVPYNPTAHRWWRLRPVSTGTIAEVSPNGMVWTTFAQSGLMLGSATTIEMSVQTDDTDATPGTAVIQGIDVCP
jgi:hypothetical protein